MKVLEVKNIGLKGIASDPSAWSLPPEFITYGINFRVFANQLISAGGYETLSEAPVQFNPGYIQHIWSTSSGLWLVAGRDAVYSFDGANWTNISSTAGYDAIGVNQELDWVGCQIGKIPVVNNPQVYPEYWSPVSPGQILQPLPWVAGTSDWAEAGQQCKLIRSHNNFLWALDLVDNGTEIPDGVRWSHPADINGLPPSWDETDPAYLAGKMQLGGDGGRIIDGQSLRNSFVVYSENAIDIFDENFNTEFVWSRRELSSTVGLLSKNCLIEVKGTHFFLADGDIVKNNGTGIESIIHNRLRRRLTSNMNVDFYHRAFAVRNNTIKEVWFCVPEGRAEYPNTAYIYNWTDDSWAIRDLPEVAHANYGPVTEPPRTWETWRGTWDEQNTSWGSRQRTPLNDTIIAVDNEASKLLVLDYDIISEVDLNTVVERTNFPLEGHPKVNTITRVYPHMEGTTPVEIQFGSQKRAGGPVRWKPAVTFTPGEDRKVDLRTTGELHAWRIKSLGTGTWRISGMTIEYADGGLR